MPVSFPDAISSYVVSVDEDPATNDLSHEVTSGTTLLLCLIGYRAHEAISAVTWNSVSLTKIIDIDASTSSGDAGGSLWGLISPTPATADFEITSSTGDHQAWHIKAGLNVAGTTEVSLAAAISNLTLDENTTATTTNVHASGGSSGNKLLFFGTTIGDDMVPASNDASFTELAELESGGSSGSPADGSMYIAEGDAPSAITVTWASNDENVGGLFEIVVAAAGGANPKGPLGSILDGSLGGPI